MHSTEDYRIQKQLVREIQKYSNTYKYNDFFLKYHDLQTLITYSCKKNFFWSGLWDM